MYGDVDDMIFGSEDGRASERLFSGASLKCFNLIKKS